MKKFTISSLFIVFLALTIAFSSLTVFAQGGNGNGNGNGNTDDGLQVKQQTQTANQGEDTQIQVQVETQSQVQNQNAGISSGTQVQVKEQAKEQKQVRDQIDVEEHRSAVSNFVHGLLDVADREGGIGEQVRIIAKEQNQSASTTIQAMEKVQTRSKIKTFFIGSDYKNLGALRSEMVQTENRLEQLNKLMENAQADADKAELQSQIQTLQQEQQKIENFVKTNESKFSLFGWLTKLFTK
ncbi:MAG: hypothetical protein WC461_00755 [Candidatus Paceibacterota bacterium]